MDRFLWWSGVVAWAAFGLFGMVTALDLFIEWLLDRRVDRVHRHADSADRG